MLCGVHGVELHAEADAFAISGEDVVQESAVLPRSAMVLMRPGSPKTWSPWLWVMKMCPMRAMVSPMRCICTCAPSPQSIMKYLERKSTICAVGKCFRVGLAEPHPSMFTLNGSIVMSSGVLLFGDVEM